jgi:hypothetical protein
MDMNFPHKHPERMARDTDADVRGKIADHQALVERIIARQAASQSAKDFAAARQGRRGTKEAVHSSFMDERMAFFAGRLPSDRSGSREPALFRTGCFRPDLAQRDVNKMDG